ncbi:hypothetical protein Tco_1151698, partial [Tanacetum coccineum]
MANEVQEQSMQTGEGTGHGLDSPRYQLGPQTQAIICETADKLYKESELTHKEFANTYEKGVEAFSSRKSDSRVVNIDKVENSEEKWNVYSEKGQKQSQNGQNQARDWKERKKSKSQKVNSDEMFETKYGQQSSRGQIVTLGPQEPVVDNILSSWYAYLNFIEEKKDFISPARLFFPTFKVDKKLFAGDNAYTLEMFMEYVENANSSYGGRLCWKKPIFLALRTCGAKGQGCKGAGVQRDR